MVLTPQPKPDNREKELIGVSEKILEGETA